jgi:cytochrome oxidase assembly protein ShyY1
VSGKLAPRFWGMHLLALVLTAAAVALGIWQYGAWQAHRDAQAVDLTSARPVPLTAVMGPDDPFPGTDVGRPVHVSGTWVPDGTVYVSGRRRAGSEGYWVVTPLAVGGGRSPALPIVRGWVAAPDDAPAPPTGRASLDAWLQPPEGTGAADADPNDDVLPQLRIGDLVQHVDQDLYGAYGVAERPAPGLERATLSQLPAVGALTSIRNILYAFEWWFFGAFAVFVWWRWVTEATEPDAATESADEPVDTASVP